MHEKLWELSTQLLTEILLNIYLHLQVPNPVLCVLLVPNKP